MDIEKQIKQFLNEECEKYKDIIWIDMPYMVRKMKQEIWDFFYEYRTIINALQPEQYKEIEKYAVQLSQKFIDEGLAHQFWYGGVVYGLLTNPD